MKNFLIILILVAVAALMVVGYFLFWKKSVGEPMAESGKTEGEENTLLPDKNEKVFALMKTNFGDTKLELWKNDAPKTVDNFIKLAESGFYNGVKFHRVIKGFMIQGGDPLTKDDSLKNRWGTGGPGYVFADEIHENNRNETGTISMANAGPNTNGSQFFINTADNNFLDTKHTVFGRVVEGMDAVRAIESLATEGPDRPIEPVVIESVEISVE